MKEEELKAALESGGVENLRLDEREGCGCLGCTDDNLKRPETTKGGNPGPSVAQKTHYRNTSTARNGAGAVYVDSTEQELVPRKFYFGDYGKGQLENEGKTAVLVHESLSHVEVQLKHFRGEGSGQLLDGSFRKALGNRADREEVFRYTSSMHPEVSIIRSSSAGGTFDSTNLLGDDTFRLHHTQSDNTIKHLRVADFVDRVGGSATPESEGLVIKVPKSALKKVKKAGTTGEYELTIEWTVGSVAKSFRCDYDLAHGLVADMFPFIELTSGAGAPQPQSYSMLTDIEICGDGGEEKSVHRKLQAIRVKMLDATPGASFHHASKSKFNGVFGVETEAQKTFAWPAPMAASCSAVAERPGGSQPPAARCRPVMVIVICSSWT